MSVIGCEVSNGRGVVRVGGAEERADIRVSKGWAAIDHDSSKKNAGNICESEASRISIVE